MSKPKHSPRNKNKEKQEEKIPKNKAILIIFIISITTIFATIFVYNVLTVYNVREYKYTLTISDRGVVGFNVDPDALGFGTISAGSSSRKTIYMKNDFDKDLRVQIRVYGEGKRFITPSDNGFVLVPGANITVTMTASPPKDTEKGQYEGTAVFVFRKA